MSKIWSGRYFLTVACGMAFLFAVVKRILPPEAVSAIITMVFVSYFDRTDRQTNGGGK